MIAALGLLVGICWAWSSGPTSRWAWSPTCPIAVVAALDAVFGGLRAYLDGIFDDKVFVVSFVSNVVIAAAIVYLGDKLGVGGQLSTGVIVVLGHPDLLQRRGDPPAPVPCLSPSPTTPSRRPSAPTEPGDRPAVRLRTAAARPVAGAGVVAVLLAVARVRRRHPGARQRASTTPTPACASRT